MKPAPLIALPGTLLDGRSLATLLAGRQATTVILGEAGTLDHILAGAGHLFPVQQPAWVANRIQTCLSRLAASAT